MSSHKDKEAIPNATYDWDNYAHYRPRYPPATTKLIMDYHRAHSNSLRLAHDIGSGSGVYVPTLSEYFQHVHVSDPNVENLSQARQRLDKWYAENWWKAKFTFSQTTAEQANECVANGSVDLCTLMMSAHWTEGNGEKFVAAVAESLAPNGTLAVVQYNPCPRVVGNERAAEAVRELYTTYGRVIREKIPWARGLVEKNNSPLDWVDLPEGVFIQGVTKRVKINAYSRESDELFCIPGQEDLWAESRVGKEQRKYWYDEGRDKEAEGWRMEVGKEWFRGSLESLRQGEFMEEYEQVLMEVERVIRETTEDGRVVVEWAVAILVATKK
ncbi:hypothetical protein M409DRAFT_57147 [Zasmidium cellare ATCC 36951]|uniref:Methyltransferase type 11 domain-containing protein n=1 Tax=Zasmidium cellare ATCC 36951 TaxID=1080233 RepID=A0A6A6CBP5_ZASCE|nr:uncharacterized protein M409DRAFT_57147 [Zasmidium cellare ATCC 36951]KAF2163640.1 hypothetical protein M409DRAFT_57147 [Zasmidium cellare ATCC 36951]